MLDLLYTSPRTVSETWNADGMAGRFAHNRQWDCLLLSGSFMGANSQLATFKVFKDGHALQCFDGSISSFPIIEMAGGLFTYTKTGSGPFTYNLYELDPFTATPIYGTPFHTFTCALALNKGWFIDYGRSLLLVGAYDGSHPKLIAYDLANPDVELWRMSLGPGSFYNTYRSIHWVADGKIMLSQSVAALGYGLHENVIFVDYPQQSVDLLTRLNPYCLAVFDSRCGVVWSINTAGHVEIYYPQAVPSQVTQPVLDPAPRLFSGSLVNCQVLGDMNEPCPDRIVHWFLTQGYGGLAKEASKTDLTGTAYNYFYGPASLPAGEETLRAEVLI